MNLLAYLAKGWPIAKEIEEAKSFPLTSLKRILDEFEKEKVLDYVIVADFRTMEFFVVPSQMTQKPKKVRQMMIGNKYFQTFAYIKTDFLTAEEVLKRVDKWSSHFDKILSKHHFYPCPIIRIDRGFMWCNTAHGIVSNEFIAEIEAEIV